MPPTRTPTAVVVAARPTEKAIATPTVTPAVARDPIVTLGEHYYAPAELQVTVGTTVIWRVVGTQTHDVTAYDGSFRSSTLGPGSTFSHRFTAPGRYAYLCTPHAGDGMLGVVVVE